VSKSKLVKILCIDLGSTHFKAQIYGGARPFSRRWQVKVPMDTKGSSAEIKENALDRCLGNLLSRFGTSLKKVQAIVMANQSPSLTLIGSNGKLLHPVITHLDKRSYSQAEKLERHFGKAWWLRVTGNRPYPGGIAVTSLFWLLENLPHTVAKAATIGSLNTYFIQKWTGQRCMDTANASFLGLFNTNTLEGWNLDICRHLRITPAQLAELKEADAIAGRLTDSAAKTYGFRSGIAVLVGTMDTSACVFGTLLNQKDFLHVSGTSDVMAVVRDSPIPSEDYLTRCLGKGRKWLKVRTLAASGAVLDWCRTVLGTTGAFPKKFAVESERTVRFDPHLAGDRLSLDPKTGAFYNLTLGSTRRDLWEAVVFSLKKESIRNFKTLAASADGGGRVWYTGGNRKFARWVHGDLEGEWDFFYEKDLLFNGLASLAKEIVS